MTLFFIILIWFIFGFYAWITEDHYSEFALKHKIIQCTVCCIFGLITVYFYKAIKID